MSRKLSQEEVRSFWTEQSRKHGQSHAASWSDRMAIELEIREILKHLNDGDRVLDVGCANGYSTVAFAELSRRHRDPAIAGVAAVIVRDVAGVVSDARLVIEHQHSH